ncbi:hypothetical protein GOP47_0007229 [Adiantum capillus-veneris]|uniref:ADP-ribosyl cyclase/cyclic ADP-ribose hydrolase n=1 Tax=Adiantum capillus-veneris TaxID=13818 RepID=A0A9D4V0X4_ADICA|nr:hypothetical protein GOP47_0007229 [Adiantum capillus-veneris]
MASRGTEYEFDVFWSHSGEQKDFVIELDSRLCNLRGSWKAGFNNFLDTKHNSLPAGQNFPPNIDNAIEKSRIAVVIISKSFLRRWWPMQELSAFQETRAIILPVFYGVKPSELASHNSDTRVAEWRQLHPHLTDKTAIRWITALDDIRSKSGYEIASSIGDVNSPKLQRRLLSDISLLLAAQVLKEERVDSENLGWACKDIDEELSAKNHTAEHMENSAALLLKWNVIPYLVAHMKFLHETDDPVIKCAGWALDHIFYHSPNANVKGEAVRAGAVEVLADMLRNEDGAKPAAFCLRSILGSTSTCNKACHKLNVINELSNGAIVGAIYGSLY